MPYPVAIRAVSAMLTAGSLGMSLGWVSARA